MLTIGQSNLLNFFELTAQRQETPRAIMLIGPIGQGKKTIAKEIAQMHNTEPRLFTPTMEGIRDIIEQSDSLDRPTFFLLADVDLLSIQAQNALLKIIEEPPTHAYFILTTSNAGGVLTTIRSRVRLFELEPYTKQQLSEYTDNKTHLRLCDNIGQIERMSYYDVDHMVSVAQKVVANIEIINAANTFNILKHIDDGDLDLFIQCLQYEYSKRLAECPPMNERQHYLSQLMALSVAKQQLGNKSLNRKAIMEVLFLTMNRGARH